MTHKILLLGGTTEARELAALLAARDDLTAVYSLAGRTASPVAVAIALRTGGFGGVVGLAEYLATNHIDVLIDATHPYAAQMSLHAQLAATQTHTPMVR